MTPKTEPPLVVIPKADPDLLSNHADMPGASGTKYTVLP